MSTREDPLDIAQDPDRVFYELGVMLDKDDFRAEQTYHRGRLARALTFLHGSGTAAGLFVRVPEPDGGGPPAPDTEEVRVGAGLAVDAVGRLIEVPSERCIRLKRWLDAQATGSGADGVVQLDNVRRAFQPTEVGGTLGNIVVDVLLRFAACDRGKTPGFATGPFDALDAVQPSRIRDAFELQLVPRSGDSPVPTDRWPDLSAVKKKDRAPTLHQAIFAAWNASLPTEPPDAKHWLYLATVQIPATKPTGDADLPARIADRKVMVDNERRSFVYTAAALARLSGL